MKVKGLIAVIGGAEASAAEFEAAEKVGALVAKAGYTVLTGGLAGVMEGASKGAKEAGGLVVGILPGSDARDANRYV